MGLLSWLRGSAPAARANDGTTYARNREGAPGPQLTPPRRKQGPYVWSLETIRTARDAQLRGQFDLPVRLAEGFRTDDALFIPYHARVATQSALTLADHPADSDAGRAACERAKRLVCTPQHVRESILGTLINHGIAIGYVRDEVRDGDAGPEIALTLTEWPLEHVRFNPSTDTLETRTKDGPTVTITHGDGRWIVFSKFGIAPWTQDACVLPGALLWFAHASGLSDWAGASYAHGQPKIIGELPAGVTLASNAAAGAALSPEATAFLDMLTAMVSGDVGAGIRPAGAKTDYLSNGSTAWQVFKELIENREKAAARIYLGTDAVLGSQGGAPGVDIGQLFNVASTRIQGDLEALERGYREGMILPWCRMHGVAEADAFARTYLVPDVDADKRSEQAASSIDRLGVALKALRDSQIQVTQEVVDALVQVLAVPLEVKLASQGEAKIPITLSPTDIARVVTVNEARAAQGLPALADGRGALFISELEAAQAAAAAKAAADAAPADGEGNEEAPEAEEEAPAEDAPAEAL